VLEEAGALGKAVTAARAATTEESTNWRTWFVLARIDARRGQATAAVAALRKARSRKSPFAARGSAMSERRDIRLDLETGAPDELVSLAERLERERPAAGSRISRRAATAAAVRGGCAIAPGAAAPATRQRDRCCCSWARRAPRALARSAPDLPAGRC
jgi:hypothetical protein